MFETPLPTATGFPAALPYGAAALLASVVALSAVLSGWLVVAWLRGRRQQLPLAVPAWRLRFPTGARFGGAEAAAWFAATAPALATLAARADGRRPLAEVRRPWAEVRGTGAELALVLGLPEGLAPHLRGQLAAWFPGARLEPLYAEAPDRYLAVPLALERPDLFPLRQPGQREPDPLLGLAALAGDGRGAWGLRVEWGPPPGDWQDWAPEAARAVRQGQPLPPRGWRLALLRAWRCFQADPSSPRSRASAGSPAEARGAEAKARAPVLTGRVIAWAATAIDGGEDGAADRAAAVAAQVAALSRDPYGNALRAAGAPQVCADPAHSLAIAPELALSPSELALLFHVPAGAHPLVASDASRTVPPTPEALAATALPAADGSPSLGMLPLGEALTAAGPVPFGLPPEARRRHLYVVGKTGAGKSTLLLGLVRAELEAGRGVALLDPHGDLAEAALRLVPPERYGETVYLDPADQEWTVPLNPLAAVPAAERGLAASGVLSAFRHLFAEAWGPRLEHILRHSLLLLLERPEPCLAQLPLLLTDAAYREGLLKHCADPVVSGFFRGEFAGYEGRFRSEALSPVLNKVGQFLAVPAVRHAAGGSGSSLPLRELLDGGGVLIANLSAGRLGEDGCALLGGLLVAGLQGAALSRADRGEAERPDFLLVADEFQRFATDAFAAILSESRKYRLSLALAHQYLEQVPPEILAATLGNAGSLAVFRAGAPDAWRLARELGPPFAPEDLTQLPGHRFCARVHRDGETLPAFSARTVPVPTPPRDLAPLLEESRRRWGRPRAAVETELADLWERGVQ